MTAKSLSAEVTGYVAMGRGVEYTGDQRQGKGGVALEGDGEGTLRLASRSSSSFSLATVSTGLALPKGLA